MARPSKYTPEEKARVLAVLAANDGNVKRTSRETNVHENTIRDWKKQAEKGALAPAVKAALPAATASAVDDWERVRDKSLISIEEGLDAGTVSSKEAVTIFGVLTDKIRLARGEATARVETNQSGPSPEEMGRAIGAALEGAFRALDVRQSEIARLDNGEDIMDAEFVDEAEEQAASSDVPALPAVLS